MVAKLEKSPFRAASVGTVSVCMAAAVLLSPWKPKKKNDRLRPL